MEPCAAEPPQRPGLTRPAAASPGPSGRGGATMAGPAPPPSASGGSGAERNREERSGRARPARGRLRARASAPPRPPARPSAAATAPRSAPPGRVSSAPPLCAHIPLSRSAAQRHGPRGGGDGRRGGGGGRERRAAAGDCGLPAQPEPAGPLPLPALPDPAGRAARGSRGRGGPAAAAQDEAPRLHAGAAAAFQRRERPAHPHGRQRQSLRRDPRQEVLRAR